MTGEENTSEEDAATAAAAEMDSLMEKSVKDGANQSKRLLFKILSAQFFLSGWDKDGKMGGLLSNPFQILNNENTININN